MKSFYFLVFLGSCIGAFLGNTLWSWMHYLSGGGYV